MGVPPYRIVYQVVKSEYDWVYLVKKTDQSNAKVLQILRRGYTSPEPTVPWERRKEEKTVYDKGDHIPLSNKGKYRRMKILASGSWDQIVETATFEAI